jgi:hydroxyethylthiazole kinase-like uncharacterized protein yjeF
MRAWESATWARGIREEDVIATVGQQLAQRILERTQPGDALLLLAGRGHNGDDVRAAAPHLPGRTISLLNITDPAASLEPLRQHLQTRPALILDGLFGIGLNRPLEGAWLELIQCLNAADLPVAAVDVPSGLDAQTGLPLGDAVRARVTWTLGAAKIGLVSTSAAEFTGRLEVLPDIGLAPLSEIALPESVPPTDMEQRWVQAEDFHQFPPARPVTGHKRTFGHVLLYAGSTGYHGAAVLAARGAMRAQPGLITVCTSPESYLPIASQLQAPMVHPWHKDWTPPESVSAILFGPGLAAPDARPRFESILAQHWLSSPHPVVVDASALDWLPACSHPLPGLRVITPHPGEAARLLRSTSAALQSDRPAALRELSKRYGQCWVVLKGHQSLVGTDRGPMTVNSSGNPNLAQGGSGDLLAGLLVGLLAIPALQRTPQTTLSYAVWRHGNAADLLSQRDPHWPLESLAAVV